MICAGMFSQELDRVLVYPSADSAPGPRQHSMLSSADPDVSGLTPYILESIALFIIFRARRICAYLVCMRNHMVQIYQALEARGHMIAVAAGVRSEL